MAAECNNLSVPLVNRFQPSYFQKGTGAVSLQLSDLA